MLKNIVMLAIDGVAPFEFGVVCEVFGIDRSDTGGPAFDFTIVTADPGPVRTSLGFDMHIMNGLDAAAEADLDAAVARARESGKSWRQIGDILGMTCQGAGKGLTA